MIVTDKFTGEVNFLIGSSNLKFFSYNRALKTCRSIGSLFKPITYLTVLSNLKKYHLNTWIPNFPISIKLQNGQNWIPKNNNYHFIGKIMLLDALANSVNIPTVNLSIQLRLKKLINHWISWGALKRRLFFFPAISLGAINLTPIEVAQIFQIIANKSYKISLSSIRFIISIDEKVLYQNLSQPEKIESVEAVYLTLFSMQNVVNYGTEKSLGYLFKNVFLTGK
ncbi:penicillin-binding transpeptidase domain-containing protein [Buchnera aphidicola]|uniref:penicillin-binding transpeptidase domain-containing protein n=1 Tax=Buchnera aphidicola TaxID=9 RepID=UPI0021C44B6A|nr:penicillin-binding transpeptidase domain-containing protein [Buchnera aphidicola]